MVESAVSRAIVGPVRDDGQLHVRVAGTGKYDLAVGKTADPSELHVGERRRTASKIVLKPLAATSGRSTCWCARRPARERCRSWTPPVQIHNAKQEVVKEGRTDDYRRFQAKTCEAAFTWSRRTRKAAAQQRDDGDQDGGPTLFRTSGSEQAEKRSSATMYYKSYQAARRRLKRRVGVSAGRPEGDERHGQVAATASRDQGQAGNNGACHVQGGGRHGRLEERPAERVMSNAHGCGAK